MSAVKAFLPAGVSITNISPSSVTHQLGGFNLNTVDGANVLAAVLEQLYSASSYRVSIDADCSGSASRVTDLGGGNTQTETWDWNGNFTAVITDVSPLNNAGSVIGDESSFIAFATDRSTGDSVNEDRYLVRIQFSFEVVGSIEWHYVNSTTMGGVIDDVTVENDVTASMVYSWASISELFTGRPVYLRASPDQIYPAGLVTAQITYPIAIFDGVSYPEAFTGDIQFTFGSSPGTPGTVAVDMSRRSFDIPGQIINSTTAATDVVVGSYTNDAEITIEPEEWYPYVA